MRRVAQMVLGSALAALVMLAAGCGCCPAVVRSVVISPASSCLEVHAGEADGKPEVLECGSLQALYLHGHNGCPVDLQVTSASERARAGQDFKLVLKSLPAPTPTTGGDRVLVLAATLGTAPVSITVTLGAPCSAN